MLAEPRSTGQSGCRLFGELYRRADYPDWPNTRIDHIRKHFAHRALWIIHNLVQTAYRRNRDSGGAKLSDAMSASLDTFEDMIDSTTRTIDFLMREGELLFVDNKRIIHARTPIAEGEASGRLMIRSWIRAS